jgi:hypothetical protein
MNTIKSAAKALRLEGFTYVSDSTLWECEGCGERVVRTARRGHLKKCPARQPFEVPPDT